MLVFNDIYVSLACVKNTDDYNFWAQIKPALHFGVVV